MNWCCVLHSSNRKTTEVAEKLDHGLQQKLSRGYSSGRFQLQDETNAQDACRELDGVECAVVLLDDDFLSILDHKKSRRLYAKIAEMLKPGCLVKVLFINVGVDDPRLNEFKEDFENKDRMSVTNYTTSEEICNYCYNNFIAVCGPTESEDTLREPMVADSLNSENMNTLNVASFQTDSASNGQISGPLTHLSAAHINTRQISPQNAVENTYSSGSTAESTSDLQESYGRQLDSGDLFCTNKACPQSLPTAVLASKHGQPKVPAESTSPLSMPDALTVTGQTVSSPSKAIGQASDQRLPSTYGRTPDLPIFSQLCSDSFPGSQQQYVHGNQPLTFDNNCYQQPQSQGGVFHDPHANRNLQGNQTKFTQDHSLKRNQSPGCVFQNMQTNQNLQFNRQGLDQGNHFPSAHQNIQLLQPFQSGHHQGTDSPMNSGHGHRLGGNCSHPVGHVPQGNCLPFQLPSLSSTSSSNVTSYVQAGYSFPPLKVGPCSWCNKQTELIMNIPVMRGQQELSSMQSHPSFGPQAMPCLSGFGICEQCLMQSLEQGPYGSGNLPTFETDMLKSLVENEEKVKSAGNRAPSSRVTHGSHPLPNTSYTNVNVSGNSLPSQMAALNIQQDHAPPSQNTGTHRLLTQHSQPTDTVVHGSSGRQTLSWPNGANSSFWNTVTARTHTRSAGDGRSTGSMPDIVPQLQNTPPFSYPSGSFFESVTDNTKMPGGSGKDVPEDRRKKRDYGTNTDEDEQSLGASGGAGGSYHRDDGSGAENHVGIYELSEPVFSYIQGIMDSSDQYNWTDLATLHGWNYGQIYALKQKFKKGMISSPFEHLMQEFQNYTVQQLKEDLMKIPRRDVLDKLRRFAQQGQLPPNCAGLFT